MTKLGVVRTRVSKNATECPCCLEVAFLLTQHLLSCCKILTVFQRTEEVGSDDLYLFLNVSVGDEHVGLPLPLFC